MRRLSGINAQLYEPVRVVGGPRTRAVIQRPKRFEQPGDAYAFPKLTCKVPLNSLIQSRQVVQIPGGEHYLVADHSATGDYRVHHLLHCDRQVSWTRLVTETDPLTDLPKATSSPADLGSIWVMWERVRIEFTDLTLRISNEQFLIATGADVQVNDLVAGNKVIRVANALGVNILVLQGMKITIGGRRVDPSRVEQAVQDQLMKAVVAEAVDMGPRYLQRVGDVAQEAATAEAVRLFDTLADIIDETGRLGMGAGDLMRGATLADRFYPPGGLNGSVVWPTHSRGYWRQKKRWWPSNQSKMFVASGRLQNYFRNQGASIVRSRLGGVRISVDTSGMTRARGAQRDVAFKNPTAPGDLDLEKILLGRVKVAIFPDIPAAMMPLLSSGRWTQQLSEGKAGEAGLDRFLFQGTKTAAKLVNPQSPYRPLVAPAVAFWALVRVPNAIFKRVQTYFKKTEIRAE